MANRVLLRESAPLESLERAVVAVKDGERADVSQRNDDVAGGDSLRSSRVGAKLVREVQVSWVAQIQGMVQRRGRSRRFQQRIEDGHLLNHAPLSIQNVQHVRPRPLPVIATLHCPPQVRLRQPVLKDFQILDAAHGWD